SAEMAAAAAAAKEASPRRALSLCGFSYRRTPALAYARQLIAEGAVGEIRQVRAHYLQDWLSDADAPMSPSAPEPASTSPPSPARCRPSSPPAPRPGPRRAWAARATPTA